MKQIIQSFKTGETILEEVPAPLVKRGSLLIQTTNTLVSLGTEKMLIDFGKSNIISKALQQPEKVKQVLEKIKNANANNENEITLFGDGTPLRQFTFADDIARIIKLMLDNNINENLNVGIEENLSINEIANLALKAANSEHLRIAYDKSKPNGQYRKDISTEKLQKLFPDFKFTSYLEGIKKTYKTITNE